MAAGLCALAGACSAAKDGADAPEPWPRSTGLKPADDAALPPGTRCAARLELTAGQLVLVCQEAGQAGTSLWSARNPVSTGAPKFSRVLRWAGAAGARLSWHRAPACPKGVPCIQGVLLADAFDDYCMGTTVLTVDMAQQLLVVGRIPEIIEVDGEAQCVGAVAVLTGPAQHADITLAQPLLRQTANGHYWPVRPPASYHLVGGTLVRMRLRVPR